MVQFDIPKQMLHKFFCSLFLELYLIVYLAKKGACLVGKWHLGLNRHVWGDNEYGPLGKFKINLNFMKLIFK
jgi:hypothetical protein